MYIYGNTELFKSSIFHFWLIINICIYMYACMYMYVCTINDNKCKINSLIVTDEVAYARPLDLLNGVY